MEKLISHLAENNYHLQTLIPDGSIHRFKRTPEDKKKSAWYVCYQAHSRAGHLFHILIYGDWREGGSHKFNTLQEATADDFSYISAQFEKAKRKQAEEQKRVWEEAAKEAEEIWASSAESGRVDYLDRKAVKPYGVRYLENALLVPARDSQGKIWSIQRITKDGKFFHPSSRTKGMFHRISGKGDDIILCEGYATGASIHEATGLTVLVCFYASNLPEVARQFENVIVCADDDQFKAENAGRVWAAKCGAQKVLFPKFTSLESKPTDFNDLHVLEGLEEVRRQILEDESDRQFVLALGHRDETYYYTSSSNRQIVKIPRAGHNKSNLMDLMPLEHWEAVYPHPKGGADFDRVANSLMQKARARGIFDPNNVRGVGVWHDEGRYIINLGDGLYYSDRRHSLDSLKSNYIYEIGPRIPEPYSSQVDLNTLPNLLATISYKHKGDNLFLLGWLTIAPVAGALEWRSHLWLTGGAGTGKTTVMRVIDRFLGRYRHYFQGQTTEAGLRQTVSNGSLAVLFDEAESSDEKSADRMQGVLELIRQASSESEAQVAKGTAAGTALASRPKFSALLSSIGVALKNEADKSRFKEIELIRGTDEAFDQFKALETKITPEFSGAYFSRTFRLLPVLQANIDVFWTVLRRRFSARVGQQLGTLLAGAWLAKTDTMVTEPEAEALCAALPMHDAEQASNSRDEVECADHLGSSLLRLDHGASKTVRDLIENGDDVLQKYGMRVDDGCLWVAARNPSLAGIFKGTRWADKWSKILIRLDGGVGKTIRINGKNTYSVSVKMEHLLEKD